MLTLIATHCIWCGLKIAQFIWIFLRSCWIRFYQCENVLTVLDWIISLVDTACFRVLDISLPYHGILKNHQPIVPNSSRDNAMRKIQAAIKMMFFGPSVSYTCLLLNVFSKWAWTALHRCLVYQMHWGVKHFLDANELVNKTIKYYCIDKCIPSRRITKQALPQWLSHY